MSNVIPLFPGRRPDVDERLRLIAQESRNQLRALAPRLGRDRRPRSTDRSPEPPRTAA